MTRLDRYVFRSAAIAFVGTLVVLAGMIWVTQALRQLDIMTSQGQTILAFVFITSLALPALVLALAPAALFMAVAHTLFRMNSDSEIVVASAAGISTWRFLRPLIILAVLVAAGCTALSMEVVPAALRQFRYEVTRVRADMVAFIAQPGRFTTLAPGMVFNVRERNASGVLGGIFINDARNPAEVSTYLADRGQIVDTDTGTFLILEDGAIHRRTPGKPDTNVVEFQRYAFDLSPFTSSDDTTVYRAPERTFRELIARSPDDTAYQRDPGRFTEEIHRRLSLPLYVMAFFGIAVAALAEPRTTREGRGLALAATAPFVVALQVMSFGLINQVRNNADLVPIVYLVPILVILGAVLSLSGFKLRMPQAIGRSIDRLAQRVVRETVN